MHGRDEKVEKAEGNKKDERPSRRWKANIKIDSV
jgi:hypothetical protein